MATKKNVFTPDLTEFLNGCGDLMHLLSFMHYKTRDAVKEIDTSLKKFKKMGWQDRFRTGTCLPIVNIFHDGEFVTRKRSVIRETGGEGIKNLALEMGGRFNAFVLVSLHEIFEEYVREAFGKLLYQLRNELTAPKKKAFHKANPGWVSRKGTYPYYRQFARFACKRDCTPALMAFDRHLAWDDVRLVRLRGVSFRELASTVASCRHYTVHQGGRVTDSDLREMPRAQQQLIRSCVRNSVHGGQKLILPDRKVTYDSIEGIASYGYGLYVLLARRCNMRIEYEPGKHVERLTTQ